MATEERDKDETKTHQMLSAAQHRTDREGALGADGEGLRWGLLASRAAVGVATSRFPPAAATSFTNWNKIRSSSLMGERIRSRCDMQRLRIELLFPADNKDAFRERNHVWKENKRLYSLPKGPSMQSVMEDQSPGSSGGLRQPLAEPHANKWALAAPISPFRKDGIRVGLLWATDQIWIYHTPGELQYGGAVAACAPGMQRCAPPPGAIVTERLSKAWAESSQLHVHASAAAIAFLAGELASEANTEKLEVAELQRCVYWRQRWRGGCCFAPAHFRRCLMHVKQQSLRHRAPGSSAWRGRDLWC